MKNIALFGGSFDPPHKGHIAIVQKLKELGFIDLVVVMPTYLNPFKSHFFADGQTRYAWLKELYEDDKKVVVSDFEISQNRAVSTIESVCELQKSYGKIYVVIGADNLGSLHAWDRFEELEKLVEFLVVTRGETEPQTPYKTLNIQVDISSTQLRDKLQREFLPPKIAHKIETYYKKSIRNTMEQRVEKITEVLDKNKAEKIEAFDLREKDYFVDFAIIASSLGQKHTLALLDHLKKELKPEEHFNNVDESGDWIVVDLGDILIHIMTPEYRTKYDMESFLAELGNATAL